MPNTILLKVVMLRCFIPSVMLSVVMLSVTNANVFIENAIMPTNKMPNAIMPTTKMPNAIMPNVIMPNVAAPVGWLVHLVQGRPPLVNYVHPFNTSPNAIKLFYARNLQVLVISLCVCPWQAFD